jgi:hypothetical protein
VSPAAAQIRRWRQDPVAFVRECLGAEPDWWQADMLRAFPKHKRLAGVACKGPGKTALEAWLGWNFLFTRPHCKVPCTSITGPNLKDGLWAEFKKWQLRSPILLSQFEWTETRIKHRQHPETWWASARTWSKDAEPEQQANTIAGLHEDYLLWLLDEASDMPNGVVSAAEAALAGGIETKMVIMGNCTRTEGPIWDAAGKRRHMFHVTRITGDPDDPKRSPRIDIDEARAQIAELGRDHYVVKVNILGEFPDRAADKLIDARDVEAGQKRTVQPGTLTALPIILGCDPARFGDDSTVVVRRRGRMCWPPHVFKKLDTVQTAEQLMKLLDDEDCDAAFVDEVGIGAGVIDTCRARGYGKRIYGVNAGEKARDEKRFTNRRAEMYWLTAEWLKEGGCLPKDDMLAAELSSPHFDYDAKQRIWLEPKEDVKARLGRSPDRADALSLTFASPVRRQQRAEVRGALARGAISTNDYNPLGGR